MSLGDFWCSPNPSTWWPIFKRPFLAYFITAIYNPVAAKKKELSKREAVFEYRFLQQAGHHIYPGAV